MADWLDYKIDYCLNEDKELHIVIPRVILMKYDYFHSNTSNTFRAIYGE